MMEVELAVLRDAGVGIYCEADGVGLTGQVRPTGITRIWALPPRSGEYSLKVAELSVGRDRLVGLMRLWEQPCGPVGRSELQLVSGDGRGRPPCYAALGWSAAKGAA